MSITDVREYTDTVGCYSADQVVRQENIINRFSSNIHALIIQDAVMNLLPFKKQLLKIFIDRCSRCSPMSKMHTVLEAKRILYFHI